MDDDGPLEDIIDDGPLEDLFDDDDEGLLNMAMLPGTLWFPSRPFQCSFMFLCS